MERLKPLPPISGGPSPRLDPMWPSRRRRRRRLWVARIPWTAYGYITGEVLRVFLLAVFAISLVYTTIAAYQTVRSGLQLSFIWPLVAKTFAHPLYFSLPLSLLFATTLVLGRMIGELEVMAMRSHGFPDRHVYVPIMGLGLALGTASYYLNGWVVPEIHFEKRNLQSYILTQLENLGSGSNRTILLENNEGTLWVGAYKGTELRRVRVDLVTSHESAFLPAIRDHLPENLPGHVTIYADRGNIEVLPGREAIVLSLRSVQVVVPETVRSGPIANEVFHQTFLVTESVRVPLSFKPKTPGIKDRSNPELARYIAQLRDEAAALVDPEPGEAAEARIEYASARESGSGRRRPETRKASIQRKLASALTEIHRRHAFTASCLTFPLVGVALSLLLSHRSRIVPFFFGNLVVIGLFYPFLMVGSAVGDRGIVPALSLALPNLALTGLGVWLARKVAQK